MESRKKMWIQFSTPCIDYEKKNPSVSEQCSKTIYLYALTTMSFHLHQNFRDRRGTDVWMPDGASSNDRAKTNRTGYIVAMCVCYWKCLIKYILRV